MRPTDGSDFGYQSRIISAGREIHDSGFKHAVVGSVRLTTTREFSDSHCKHQSQQTIVEIARREILDGKTDGKAGG